MWPLNHPTLSPWLWPPPTIPDHWYTHRHPAWSSPPSSTPSKTPRLPLPLPLYPPPWITGTMNLPPIWQCIPPPHLMKCTDRQSGCEAAAPSRNPSQTRQTSDASLASSPPDPHSDEGFSRDAKRVKCSQPEKNHGKSEWYQMPSQKHTVKVNWYQGVGKFNVPPDPDLSFSSCSSHDNDLDNVRPPGPPSTFRGVWLENSNSHMTQPDTSTLVGRRLDSSVRKHSHTSLCPPKSVTHPTPTTQSTPVTQPTLKTRSKPVTQPTLKARHKPVTWLTPVDQPMHMTEPRPVTQHIFKTWTKPRIRNDRYTWHSPMIRPTPKATPSPVRWPTPTTNTDHSSLSLASPPGVRSVPKHAVSNNLVMNESHSGTEKDKRPTTCNIPVHEMKLDIEDVDIKEEEISEKDFGCMKLRMEPLEKVLQLEKKSRNLFRGLVVKREMQDDTAPADQDSKERLKCAFPSSSHTANTNIKTSKETCIKTEDWEVVKTEEPISDAEGEGGSVRKPLCEPKIKSELTSAKKKSVGAVDLPQDFDIGEGLLLDQEFLEASMEAVVPVCRIHLALADGRTNAEEDGILGTTLATTDVPTTTLATTDVPTTTLATTDVPTTTLATTDVPTTTLATTNTPTTILATAHSDALTLAVTMSHVTRTEYQGVLESPNDDFLSVRDDSSESLETQIFEDEERPRSIIDNNSPSHYFDFNECEEYKDLNTEYTNRRTLEDETSMSVMDNCKPSLSMKLDPLEIAIDCPAVNRSGVVTDTTGGTLVGRTHETLAKSAATKQPLSTKDASSLASGGPSHSKQRETSYENTKLGRVKKRPRTTSPRMCGGDPVGHMSKEDIAKAMSTCSYVLMDRVSDTCLLGHQLDPSCATLNVRTRRIAVTCTTCDITIYMNVG